MAQIGCRSLVHVQKGSMASSASSRSGKRVALTTCVAYNCNNRVENSVGMTQLTNRNYGLHVDRNKWCRVGKKVGRRSQCAGAVTGQEGSSGGDSADVPQSTVVVVLECDGILVDIHNTGHRKAFNLAFEV